MDLWADVERRIRERGVRVEARLALVALLRAENAQEKVEARRSDLLTRFDRARETLRREALRGEAPRR